MKKILITFLTFLSAGMAFAQGKFFDECENIKGVTTVYISSAMMRMISGNLTEVSDKFNLSALADKIDSLIVVQAEGGESAKKVDQIAASMYDFSKGYDLLMTVKDEDNRVRILYKNLGNNKNEYVLIARESAELTYIIITGSITPDDVRTIH